MPKSAPAENTNALRLLTATPETIREETVDGHEFLVVPVVALTEGVFQCANCPQPELYLAAEFGRVADAWNGRPVTLGHPKRGGRFVSAGSMDVRRKDVVGDIQNARVDGDKLKVEAWIDLEMVAQLGSRAQDQVERLEEGQEVEVSVGAFIDREPMVGSFKGRNFGAVQRELRAGSSGDPSGERDRRLLLARWMRLAPGQCCGARRQLRWQRRLQLQWSDPFRRPGG